MTIWSLKLLLRIPEAHMPARYVIDSLKWVLSIQKEVTTIYGNMKFPGSGSVRRRA
jgi:hypothetical protein